jgi:DNA (cytosine-5)-methyltransferase 1
MTTACINPSKGRFVHPMQHHGITAGKQHASRLFRKISSSLAA